MLNALDGSAGLVRSDHRDAQFTGVESRTRSRGERTSEPVDIVRDEDDRGGRVAVPVRAGPVQVESSAFGPQQGGHGVDERLQLRVAVRRALDRFGVDAE